MALINRNEDPSETSFIYNARIQISLKALCVQDEVKTRTENNHIMRKLIQTAL